MRKYMCGDFLSVIFLPGCSTEPVLSYATVSDPPQVMEARRVLNDEINRTPFVDNLVVDMTPGDYRTIQYAMS